MIEETDINLSQNRSRIFEKIGVDFFNNIKKNAIEVAWNRGRIEALDEAFGRNVCSLDDKPTNGEFIALVSDRLRVRETA